ncbi:LOW QUALITY PROTEIN: uncharacterized protein ACR2FA_010539 [Aphomia sociella]
METSILILLTIYADYKVNCACTLDLNKDFGVPPPVYLRDGQFLSPDGSGAISLQRSETVQVACPGSRRRVVTGNTTTGYDFVEAHCIVNKTFRVDRWIGQFVDVHCNIQPSPDVVATRERCYGNNEVISVGFDIRNKFYQLYEACFDRGRLTTLYVKHRLTPASIFSQSNYGNKKFIDGLHHEKVINSAYKQQAARIDAVLGPGMSKNYITRKQFLARGHLAARTDFIMRSDQRATYQYVNSAPQWQRGNSGDWAALEAALRQRIHSYGSPVTVYTGTAGVLSLTDQAGKLKELYLHVDENNNGIIPVPLYFFKLVYDPKQRAAAAFVSVNTATPNRTAVFLPVISGSPNRTAGPLAGCRSCGRHAWLHWRPRDNTDSFCCDYAALAAQVPHLPRLDVKTLFC